MNSVSIQLDAQHTELLAKAARASGRSYEDLVAEALERTFGSASVQTTDAVVTQRQALNALRAELASLPVVNPTDGFRNRDHDQVLYGDKS